MDELTKEAQKKRGKWDEFSEWAAPIGKAVEHFSPEFGEIMELLRGVDENVRSIATGEEPAVLTKQREIKDQNSAEDEPKGEPKEEQPVVSDPGKTLKDLIRVAETNFKRREYMTAISYLGRFHERAEAINAEFAKLEGKVNVLHHKFLFDDVDPDQVEYLMTRLAPKFRKNDKTMNALKEFLSKKKASPMNAIVVEAGVGDWWRYLTSDRFRTLAGWEKRFPKKAREIKAQTNSMISRSQSLLSNLLTTLKQLNGYRNGRKLEEYLQTAARWRERYRAYNTAFTSFYNSQIKQFVDYQEDQRKAKEQAENKTEQKLEESDGEPHQKNEPADWFQGSNAQQLAGEPGKGAVSVKPLAQLGPKDPVPAWDDLPEDFRNMFDKVQKNTKKMKPWEELSDEQKRMYHRLITTELNVERKKAKPKSEPGVVFPKNKPETPAASAPASSESISSPPPAVRTPPVGEVASESDPGPSFGHAGAPHAFAPSSKSPFSKLPEPPFGHAGVPHTFAPSSKSPFSKLPAPPVSPFSQTMRSPVSTEAFPLTRRKPLTPPPSTGRDSETVLSQFPISEPYTEVEPMHTQLPRPPRLPADLMIDTSRGRRAHTEFLNELEAKASEHPMVQAAFVLDYAKEIEADSPEQCKQLRALASSILGK